MENSSNIHEYGFKERLVFSQGIGKTSDTKQILLENIPSAINVLKSNLVDDRSGTDYWVERKSLPRLSVDVKRREIDPTQYEPPRDDLALETYSNLACQTPGWTRDKTKATDYILWYFEPTWRWVLIPFPMLCKVFCDKWQLWRTQYEKAKQKTVEGSSVWHSERIFVPRVVIWREIYKRYGGLLTQKEE